MWELLLIGITAVLFLLPLVPAVQEWRLQRDIIPLNIIQSHAGHTRHFSDTFRIFIQNEISALSGQTQSSDSPKNYCLIEENDTFKPSQDERQDQSTQRILFACGTLTLPDNFSFPREIYSKKTVVGMGGNHLRAILAEDKLIIGSRSTVLRWAHAHTIHIDSDCHLIGRLSAVEEITLEVGCIFTRIHAPCVKFGTYVFLSHDEVIKENTSINVGNLIPHQMACSDNKDNRWISEGDFEFPENEIFCGDIVARGNVIIRRGAKITGSVKANGTLHVEPFATITGSLISTKQLILAQSCVVGGPVVSEQRINMDTGVVVGTVTTLTTLSAPVIQIVSGCIIYGTVWARQQGVVLSAGKTA